MSDPRSEYFGYLRHESAPPDHIFGRRMEVLTLAVIAQLHASGNFHRIAREWFYGDPPATELGEPGGRVLRARRGVAAGRSPYNARGRRRVANVNDGYRGRDRIAAAGPVVESEGHSVESDHDQPRGRLGAQVTETTAALAALAGGRGDREVRGAQRGLGGDTGGGGAPRRRGRHDPQVLGEHVGADDEQEREALADEGLRSSLNRLDQRARSSRGCSAT